MRTLSLFSGCGGLDLGLEQVGIQTACLVEIDPDCAKVYKERCADLEHMQDVHKVTAKLGTFEIVVGGFPCQDLSYAGRGAGLDGDKSGLWFEMIRVVRELQPRLVVVENVPGLLTRGIVVVIHDLARAGYAGRWFTMAAADVGAPHRRERVFMVAKRVTKRGEELAGPNPSGLFSDDGWVSPQESLFDQDFLRRLGKRGRWSLDGVYEEDARLALDDDDETLLPTPNAMESTPTAEYVQEVKDADVQPDARLYLPGRKWHAQRTLSRVAPALLPTPVRADGNSLTDGDSREGGGSLREIDALLPTPGAWLGRRPENATADPERHASRDHEGVRGKRSVELPDALAAGVDTEKLLPTPALLPTPTHSDGNAGGRDPRAPEDRRWPNAEDTLRDAVKMLPTPTAQDAANTGGPSQMERNTPPLNAEVKLMPTPNAGLGEHRRDNGQDPEKRREQGKQVSLADVVRYEVEPTLLPTPNAGTTPEGHGRRGGTAGNGHQSGADLDAVAKLLPTPKKSDAKGADRARAENRTGARHAGDDLGAVTEKLLPTPVVTDAFGSRRSTARTEDWVSNPGTTLTDALWELEGRETDTRGNLLPTPSATHNDGHDPERFLERREAEKEKGQNGNGFGLTLGMAAQLLPTPVANPENPGAGGELRAALEHGPGRRNETGVDSMGRPNTGRPSKVLPTPTAADGDRVSEQGPRFYAGGGDNPTLLGAARRADDGEASPWGVYDAAIRRWERNLGRPAPPPTDEKSRLSPAFVEWMMGAPDGWTDVPGVTRTARLRMLGNSVVVPVAAQVGLRLLALDAELE